jgi:hypothetical protein
MTKFADFIGMSSFQETLHDFFLIFILPLVFLLHHLYTEKELKRLKNRKLLKEIKRDIRNKTYRLNHWQQEGADLDELGVIWIAIWDDDYDLLLRLLINGVDVNRPRMVRSFQLTPLICALPSAESYY